MFSWGKKKEPEIPSQEEKRDDDARDENLQQTQAAQHDSPSEQPFKPAVGSESPKKPSSQTDENQEQQTTNKVASTPPSEALKSPALSPHAQSPASPPTTSWSEALYRACRSKPTFLLTPRQVLQEQQQVIRPRQEDVIVFQNVKTTAKAVVEQLHKTAVPSSTTATTSSYSRSVYNGVAWGISSVAWGVGKVYQYVVADPDDIYEKSDLDWQEQEDDVNNESVALVPWEEPVVCMQLLAECVNELRPHCQELQAVSLNTAMGKYSFAEWAQKACPLAKGLQQRHDQDLLVHVLVELGHARMVDNDQYLVFGVSPNGKNVEFCVSMVRLNLAIEASERQIQQWEQEKEKCTRQALEKKKRQDMNGAKTELAKRNLLQHKIDAAHGSLLNLVQTRDTLETSHFQQTQVYESLAAAKSAFAALREGSSVENADELLLDLLEEQDHVNELSSALLPEQQQEFDEDELLEELMNLKLDDDYDAKLPSNKEEDDRVKEEDVNGMTSTAGVAVDSEKENKTLVVESSKVDVSNERDQGDEQDGDEKRAGSVVETPAT